MSMSGRWSAEETAELHRMKAAGSSEDEIAKKIGRSAHAVYERWRWVNKSEIQKEARREQINRCRRDKVSDYVSCRPHPTHSRSASRPPADMFVEAHLRLNAPRTLSQQLMGDPPPGYSALDRKRSGERETAHIDHRLAQLQRKPTLAGVS